MKGLNILRLAMLAFGLALSAKAEQPSLRTVVTPSSIFEKDGKPVHFAIHGYIEFKSLSEALFYVESQIERWHSKITGDEERQLRSQLLRQAVESRVVSMLDERPLEALVTNTAEELRRAITDVKEPLPDGYLEAFLAARGGTTLS